jgi:hypothetical protein
MRPGASGKKGAPVIRTCMAAATLALVGGCGSDDGRRAGETNRSGAEAPAAAQAARPGAAPAGATPAAEPVLTAEGYGPLRIGMTLAEVAAAMGPDSDPAAVGGPEPESCDQFRPARAPEGLLVMIEDGRLTRISLHDGAKVATDKDLKVGATRAEVRAAHGPELRSEPHEYESPEGEYLTVWTRAAPGPDGMAGPEARGIRYEVGATGRVDIIHAGGPSIQLVEGCL